MPTIDLSGWWAGDRASRSTVARELDRAARSVGFMQVVGHRITPSTIAGLTRGLDAFFGLPTHVKQRWVAPPHVNRGFAQGRTPYEDVTVAEHLAQKPGGSRGLELNVHASREASRIGSSAA